MTVWTGLNWLRIESNGTKFGHGNEYSVSIKLGNLFTSWVTINFSRFCTTEPIRTQILFPLRLLCSARRISYFTHADQP